MRQFKDFGIVPEIKNFVGDKIKMDRILNKEITVIDYTIEDSILQNKPGSKCLYLQIAIKGDKHVVFSGSIFLMNMIQKVPRDDFPFQTTIVKVDGHLEFT
jgi:hypothetical protein